MPERNGISYSAPTLSDTSPPEPRHGPGGAIELAPYSANWPAEFQNESATIRRALSGIPITLHHIGSTSIPGIVAKPVIDMLGVVPAIRDIDDCERQLAEIGYEGLGEFGISGRRYFRKTAADGARTHHLHVFAKGSAAIDRHLDFRDYLRAFPADAAAYAELKRKLAAQFTGEDYSEGKTEFIRAIEQRAAAWREEIVRGPDEVQMPRRTRVLRAMLFWLIVVSVPVLLLWLSNASS